MAEKVDAPEWYPDVRRAEKALKHLDAAIAELYVCADPRLREAENHIWQESQWLRNSIALIRQGSEAGLRR